MKTTNIYNGVLEFGGFYESIHSYNIDNRIEAEIDYLGLEQDSPELEKYQDNIDYEKTQKEYCKNYIDYFKEYISEKYNLKIDIEYKGLNSPKYYNYFTDVIEYTLPNEQMDVLYNKFKDNKEFKEYVTTVTTPSPEYSPSYNLEQVYTDNSIFTMFILDFIANELLERPEYLCELEFEVYNINN